MDNGQGVQPLHLMSFGQRSSALRSRGFFFDQLFELQIFHVMQIPGFKQSERRHVALHRNGRHSG